VTKLLLSVGLFLLALTSLSIAQQPVFGPPVNLGPRINTASHELDPFLTADGKKLFFSDGADIWFSEWLNNNWTQAVRLGPQINFGIHLQTSPSVSPDGQKLYYVDASRDGYWWDIWVSNWDSSINDWGNPQNLNWPVNTPGVEHSARIGPDGQHLYFSSSVSDSVDSLNPNGRCGLYISELFGSNWSIPTELGAGFCGISDYPSITADISKLYYDQYVSDGVSVFVNCWNQTTWGPQVDLRSQIGGRAGRPYITSSGDSLFFAGSTDLGGFGGADIWMARRMLSGDLNLDSQLTAADVVLELNRVFLEEPYPAPPAAGEMTCDGLFTPADVVALLLTVFRMSESSAISRSQ
ncbi:MAG: hypothetical protein L0Y74_08200, partial [candidate division Zixibacteria bacterium]|nr:hypothetical protein [candidate division Zixibacteria bacterium]